MLDTDDLVLAALEASGGVVVGRTRLQKLVYLASQVLHTDCGYRPHYYGPYSSEVAATVDGQVSRRVLAEMPETFGAGAPQFPGHDGELRRYTYALTPDGRSALDWHRREHGSEFDGAVEVMRRLVESGAEWKVLCYAAKLYHILRAENSLMTFAAARQRAQELGWEMQPEEITQGLELLKHVRLVETK